MHTEESHTVIPFEKALVRLHPRDHVAIAKGDLETGTLLISTAEDSLHPRLLVRQFVPSGHKVALGEIPLGAPVYRYGQIIGFAQQAIQPGEHVHTHNLGIEGFDRQHAFGMNVAPVALVPEGDRRRFMGYRREDGRVGTRNYVAVISTVNCSAHATRQIAHHFAAERLADYPNVDGIIALTHALGCGMRKDGPEYVVLQRTLAGMARHPNVGAAIFVGLGCEVNQIHQLVENHNLVGPHGGRPPGLVIQELGGTANTVRAGIETVEELLPAVNAVCRTPYPISHLTLALQCGGSDAWSGVTANPVVGLVADQLVAQGGTVVLAETPEVYGAEQLLTSRAISQAVGVKLLEKVSWWESHAERLGTQLDVNRSPGNIAGGLTTIYEKALGAVAKSGHTPLMDVVDYAAPVTARGVTFMDSTGNDWVSVTGQVAGGCNLVLFTTGRGSVFGFKPAPCIKIATNTALFERMRDDMDLNAGLVLDGVEMGAVAARLLDLVVEVASGRPSKSEALGAGEEEFNPWHLGEMM